VHAAGASSEVLLLTPVKYEELCATYPDLRQLLLASTPSYASFNFFVGCKLLRGASHELVQAVAKEAALEMHVSGTVLLRPGELPKAVYFVQRGRLAKALSEAEDDTRELGVGDHFGFMPPEAEASNPDAESTYTGTEHHVKVATVSDCLLLAITAARLGAVVSAHPQLAELMKKAAKEEEGRAKEARLARHRPAGDSMSASFAGKAASANGGGGAVLVSAQLESTLGTMQRSLDTIVSRLGALEVQMTRIRGTQDRQELRAQEQQMALTYQDY